MQVRISQETTFKNAQWSKRWQSAPVRPQK
jgi:hypothetical protein